MSCQPLVRTFSVKAGLASWQNLNFPRSGGYLVALGSFTNVEISLEGDSHANPMPVAAGSLFRWPTRSVSPEDHDGEDYSFDVNDPVDHGDEFETISGVAVHQTGGGSGTVTFVHYESHDEALEAARDLAGGGAPASSTDGIPEAAEFSAGSTATGAAAEYSRQTANLYTVVLADQGNTANVFVAETLAKATAALGFPLAPGASVKWFGPVFLFSAAAQVVYPLEALSA